MSEQQPEPSPEEAVRAAAGLANSATLALRIVEAILAGDQQAVQTDAQRIDSRGWGTAVAVAACGLMARLLETAEQRGWLGDMTAAQWACGCAMAQLDESLNIQKHIDGNS
ncbi:hypothetical protein LAUMK35_04050 [Mycobacterium pseudokansasii]|nr:hypothetical protein LAUMK35_04050 [Mycobacterium pseudokansasii]VAZ99992.1 hypothetical protein LAUMK21_04046 [Mycobacterium pseudokansasii]